MCVCVWTLFGSVLAACEPFFGLLPLLLFLPVSNGREFLLLRGLQIDTTELAVVISVRYCRNVLGCTIQRLQGFVGGGG